MILSAEYSLNAIVQWALLVVVLVLAVAWVVRRVARKNDNGCGCGCEGCSMSHKCRDKDKNQPR